MYIPKAPASSDRSFIHLTQWPYEHSIDQLLTWRSWKIVRVFVLFISKLLSYMGHVESKARSQGQT